MTNKQDAEMNGAETISSGMACLGIELGSTQIKGILIDGKGQVLASGTFRWVSEYIENNWTYGLEQVWSGIQSCYSSLVDDVIGKWQVAGIPKLRCIGISAMMHGYLAFDQDDRLLTPFRTWRNVYTSDSANLLTKLHGQVISERWSIAHLLHAVRHEEPHVDKIHYLTTLAGYVHWRLSGEKMLGVGDASGMFPIDPEKRITILISSRHSISLRTCTNCRGVCRKSCPWW